MPSRIRKALAKRRRNRLLKASKPVELKPIGIECSCDIKAGEASEEGGEALPTFTMIANTGIPMQVSGYYQPVIVNMKGVKFAAKTLPVVADHDISVTARVGHTTKIEKTAKSITVHGVLSATGQTASEIRADAKNGFPFQASIGARVDEAIHVPEGDTTKVNGTVHKGPIVVASKTTIYEFTVTSVGADQNTSFEVAASMGDGSNEMNFEKWLKARGLTLSKLSEETTTALKACYDAEIKAAQDAGNNTGTGDGDGGNANLDDELKAALDQATTDIRANARAERIRATKFLELEAEYGDDIEASKMQELRLKADTEDWDADRYELQLRRDARPEGKLFGIHSHSSNNSADVIECSLLLNSGYSNEEHVGKMFKEDVINAAMSQHNRNYSLKRLCHEVIQAAGMHHQFGSYDNAFIRKTIEADARMIRAVGNAPGATSPISVSGILSNVMHKLLLRTFMGDSNGMATLGVLSSSRTVTDFKDHPVYRLTGIGEYGDVEPGGELKGMSLGEEENSISADTRGVLMVLDRVHIVNDDLGAFAKVPAIIGRKARMKFLKVGYATFLDDAAFYTTARGNLLESTAFDIDGITAAVRLFRKMKDIGGDPVDVNPSNIITSSLYEVAADQFYKDTGIMVWDRDAAGTATNAHTTGNPHKGKYVPSSTSWLDTDSIVGGTDDTWYICSSEEDMKPLQVAYLNGNRTPVIERCELPADRLGLGWRSYFDFGFARQEWRGSVKVLAGAAAVLLAAMEEADKQDGKKPPARRPANRK